MALGDVLHPDPARLAIFGQFHRTDDVHLAHRAAPAFRTVDRIVPGPERHLRFIDFNNVLQWVAVRVDHRPPKLVQQQPRRLVTAEAKLGLELPRRHPVRMTGDDVRGEEPCPQWQMAAMHHRASRH